MSFNENVTGYRAKDENDGKRHMESVFTSLLTPVVTRSRARSGKWDIESTKEPKSKPPKQTPPVLIPPTQTPSVPTGSAAVDNIPLNIFSKHDDEGKEVEPPPVGEHHDLANTITSPACITDPAGQRARKNHSD